MKNQLRLRLPLRERRCTPTEHPRRSLRRRRPYVVTFEHVREPLHVRAVDLRELRAYLQTSDPGKPIVSIRDEHGNLAGAPPVPATYGAAAPWQVAFTLTLALGALGYGLSWLLT